MGGDHNHSKTSKKRLNSSSSSYTSSSDDDDVGASPKRRKRSHKRHRISSDNSYRRDKDKRREKKRRKREKRDEQRHRKRRSKREEKKKVSDSDESGYSDSDNSVPERVKEDPEAVARYILKEFPGVAGDLEQLLQTIDDGQAVDISGLSERSLVKHLRKLFLSLNLKENVDQVFILPSKVCPTLEIVGAIIRSSAEPQRQQLDHSVSQNDIHSIPPDVDCRQVTDDSKVTIPCPKEDAAASSKRMIGPEMPSAELLVAAAKLTEAEAELREAELEFDTELFIGPPPPAIVKEAESANEAERFEEVTRIMGAEVDSPYDVLGINRNMSSDHVTKRYHKLSLIVHPDKCSHPEAHQAFIKLKQAVKDLQDPDKRKALDDKIKQKEEQELFKAELKVMREAAQWRRLQGISMEGDDILLEDMDVKVAPKREEWMTTLPPERKPGMTMQSTKFSRSSKEGRGDTSIWTDTPSERAQKAKMNYLEAYNEAASLASNEEEKTRTDSDAALVDQYNKAKRSKSMVEKHQEAARSRSKKKSKQEPVKEEWQGKHPWKPWDREKDLTAGRQSSKFDAENMTQGISSRFSSGSFQRNFL